MSVQIILISLKVAQCPPYGKELSTRLTVRLFLFWLFEILISRTGFCLFFRMFEALRPGQQFFSHFGRLPGFNRY